MADIELLKRLAEAAQFGLQLQGIGYTALTVVSSDGAFLDWHAQRDVSAFAQAANPAAILELIAENEALKQALSGPHEVLAKDLVKELVDNAQAILENSDDGEDEFYIVLMASAERLRRQEAKIDQLKAENEWLMQHNEFLAGTPERFAASLRAVADALGLGADRNVHADCVPAIAKLKAENEALRRNAKLEAADLAWSESDSREQSAEIALLKAELERVRADAERASYWKQRAKSAEGHLLAGDFDVAAKALHKRTAMASTPWEELADDKRLQIQQAAFEVIHAVNSQRDERMPADAEMGKGGDA